MEVQGVVDESDRQTFRQTICQGPGSDVLSGHIFESARHLVWKFLCNILWPVLDVLSGRQFVRIAGSIGPCSPNGWFFMVFTCFACFFVGFPCFSVVLVFGCFSWFYSFLDGFPWVLVVFHGFRVFVSMVFFIF